MDGNAFRMFAAAGSLAAALACGACGAAIAPQVKQGNVAFVNRQWEEAIVLLDKAAEAKPAADSADFYFLYNSLSLAYIKVGSYEQALKTADIIVQGRPKYSYGYFIRGDILSRMGRHEDALADVEKGLSLNYPRLKSATAKAKVLLRAGRTAEGLALANQTIRASGEEPYTFFDLAEAMDELGLKIEALAAYKGALQIKDTSGKLAAAAVTGGLLGYMKAKSETGAKLPEAWAAFARQRIAALEEELGKEPPP